MNRTVPIAQVSEVAKELVALLQERPVMTFQGDLGAGKTTLIKEMLTQLGSTDVVASPTFSLVNEYLYPQGKIFHLDLYRIEDVEELLDIGFEEIVDSRRITLIEWPEIGEELLPEDAVRVSIEHHGDTRKYNWS